MERRSISITLPANVNYFCPITKFRKPVEFYLINNIQKHKSRRQPLKTTTHLIPYLCYTLHMSARHLKALIPRYCVEVELDELYSPPPPIPVSIGVKFSSASMKFENPLHDTMLSSGWVHNLQGSFILQLTTLTVSKSIHSGSVWRKCKSSLLHSSGHTIIRCDLQTWSYWEVQAV